MPSDLDLINKWVKRFSKYRVTNLQLQEVLSCFPGIPTDNDMLKLCVQCEKLFKRNYTVFLVPEFYSLQLALLSQNADWLQAVWDRLHLSGYYRKTRLLATSIFDIYYIAAFTGCLASFQFIVEQLPLSPSLEQSRMTDRISCAVVDSGSHELLEYFLKYFPWFKKACNSVKIPIINQIAEKGSDKSLQLAIQYAEDEVNLSLNFESTLKATLNNRSPACFLLLIKTYYPQKISPETLKKLLFNFEIVRLGKGFNLLQLLKKSGDLYEIIIRASNSFEIAETAIVAADQSSLIKVLQFEPKLCSQVNQQGKSLAFIAIVSGKFQALVYLLEMDPQIIQREGVRLAIVSANHTKLLKFEFLLTHYPQLMYEQNAEKKTAMMVLHSLGKVRQDMCMSFTNAWKLQIREHRENWVEALLALKTLAENYYPPALPVYEALSKKELLCITHSLQSSHWNRLNANSIKKLADHNVAGASVVHRHMQELELLQDDSDSNIEFQDSVAVPGFISVTN